jgi:hypothetical protein
MQDIRDGDATTARHRVAVALAQTMLFPRRGGNATMKKTATRKLVLDRETISNLELETVTGGAATQNISRTLQTLVCTQHCPTLRPSCIC